MNIQPGNLLYCNAWNGDIFTAGKYYLIEEDFAVQSNISRRSDVTNLLDNHNFTYVQRTRYPPTAGSTIVVKNTGVAYTVEKIYANGHMILETGAIGAYSISADEVICISQGNCNIHPGDTVICQHSVTGVLTKGREYTVKNVQARGSDLTIVEDDFGRVMCCVLQIDLQSKIKENT